MNRARTMSQLSDPENAQRDIAKLVSGAKYIMPPVNAASATSAPPSRAYVRRRNAMRSLTPSVAVAPKMGRRSVSDCIATQRGHGCKFHNREEANSQFEETEVRASVEVSGRNIRSDTSARAA